jgi:hypothetical protein
MNDRRLWNKFQQADGLNLIALTRIFRIAIFWMFYYYLRPNDDRRPLSNFL